MGYRISKVEQGEGQVALGAYADEGAVLPVSPTTRMGPVPGAVFKGDGNAFPLPAAGIKVLVIDDEEAVLQVTCMMMKKLGMIPLGVSSGVQGMEHMLRNVGMVDLLFLDIMLADTSGFVVYQRVRRRLPKLPVVLFSGYASRSALQSILEQDPNVRFLSKPFAVGDILTVVTMAG